MQARAELARKVARMWEEQIQDPREAADAWRRVLRMRPADEEATQGLERAKTNMLKKPDPNAGPDAYAPPKPSVSVPPPEPVKPEPKVEAKKSEPKVDAKSKGSPKAASSGPSLPSKMGALKSPASAPNASKVDDKSLPPTIEVESAASLASLGAFGKSDDDPEVDDALDALEFKETKTEAKKPVEESTAPHALSVELIATIRGAGSNPPPAKSSPPTPSKTADEKKSRAPMKPMAARAPSSPPPPDLSKTAATPFQAIDEELHTTPGGVPVFRAALDDLEAKRDTDEHAAKANGEESTSDDEPEPTIMGKSFDFSDQTEVHHPDDIPIEAGSEPMLVDDIAELVDDEPVEDEKPKQRTVPPPLPRN
jgi:hypothetical protein